jgi:hypothetical protein
MMLFKDAKVGDAVAITGRYGDITKGAITAITNTQVTVDGAKFTRSKGSEISGTKCSYDKRDIEPWTAKIEDRIASRAEAADREKRKEAAVDGLRMSTARITRRFGALTDDQILAVSALAAHVDAAVTAILGEKP